MHPVGFLPMPPDFKYREVFILGKPVHVPSDDFSLRHPAMDPGKRAKIFAPFDALRGFNFAIMTQQVLCEKSTEPVYGTLDEIQAP